MYLGITFILFILVIAVILWFVLVQLNVHSKLKNQAETFKKEKLEDDNHGNDI